MLQHEGYEDDEDDGPVTSTPNPYGLSQRTVVPRKSLRGDASVSTAGSASTIKTQRPYRTEQQSHRRQTVFRDSTDNVGEYTGEESFRDRTRNADQSAGYDASGVHPEPREEPSSLGDLDVPDLSRATHTGPEEPAHEITRSEFGDEVSQRSDVQPHYGSIDQEADASYSSSERREGLAEQLEVEDESHGDYNGHSDELEPESVMEYEIPIKEGSEDSVSGERRIPTFSPQTATAHGCYGVTAHLNRCMSSTSTPKRPLSDNPLLQTGST
jgi:hypothetical protein